MIFEYTEVYNVIEEFRIANSIISTLVNGYSHYYDYETYSLSDYTLIFWCGRIDVLNEGLRVNINIHKDAYDEIVSIFKDMKIDFTYSNSYINRDVFLEDSMVLAVFKFTNSISTQQAADLIRQMFTINNKYLGVF